MIAPSNGPTKKLVVQHSVDLGVQAIAENLDLCAQVQRKLIHGCLLVVCRTERASSLTAQFLGHRSSWKQLASRPTGPMMYCTGNVRVCQEAGEFCCEACEFEDVSFFTTCRNCGAAVPAQWCVKCDSPSPMWADRCLNCLWPLKAVCGRLVEDALYRNKALAQRQEALADPDIDVAFPYLEWLTVGNGKLGSNDVRHAHAVLHGKIFHTGDPFWKQFYPPTDDWCRCTAVSLTAGQVRRRRLSVYTMVGVDERGLPMIAKKHK